ncbi:MAG: FKBP-type peptidyl-prolyl cis-trans isomerase SlyD [Limisphaerales bacterium]|jgi:FKBP-type peptidyl-prolyl cis-trans isomerase SlyD
MKITNNHVVGIEYKLTNDGGETLDTSEEREPLYFIYGNGHIIVGLEEALDGKEKGAKFDVKIPPMKGYGERQEEMVQKVPRDQFPADAEIEVGMQFRADTPEGPVMITVKETGSETVTIDGNHPLAGETLNFDVEIVDVREASAEELEHGHVHGPGGVEH